MKRALLAGIFDPPTLGHLEIIQRSAKLFDRLYVGVAETSSKRTSSFTAAERKDLLERITIDLAKVEVITFSGLVVDCAAALKIDVLVRGVRNATDFDYEYQMAAANRQMTGIETLLLAAAPPYVHLSSTLSREIALSGRRLHGFVPEAIEEAVFKRLS